MGRQKTATGVIPQDLYIFFNNRDSHLPRISPGGKAGCLWAPSICWLHFPYTGIVASVTMSSSYVGLRTELRPSASMASTLLMEISPTPLRNFPFFSLKILLTEFTRWWFHTYMASLIITFFLSSPPLFPINTLVPTSPFPRFMSFGLGFFFVPCSLTEPSV